MKLLFQGSEAKVYRDKGNVVKHRFGKTYRIDEIDSRLRGFRTRREAKVLEKLHKIGVAVPRLVSSDGKEMLRMEFVDGLCVRDVFDTKWKTLCKYIARSVSLMHAHDIIHGDLTTSNMIHKGRKIYLIDFGLAFFSHKIEDKAVDLHLLKEGLSAKHSLVYERAFGLIQALYCDLYADGKKMFDRLVQVEKRGRYKGKRKN